MFLGCSLLSIVEILFYITCKIYNWIRKRENQDDIQDLSAVAKEVELLSIRVERMQGEWDQKRKLCSNRQIHQQFAGNNDEVVKDLLKIFNNAQEVLLKLLEGEEEKKKADI